MDDLWTTLAVNFGASLIATVFVYLLVPCIILISGKKYKAKTIKKIIIINCIVGWVLFRVIQLSLGDRATAGTAVFIWGGIGYWMLMNRCLKKDSEEAPDQATPVASEPTTSSGGNAATPYSLSNIDETPETCGNPAFQDLPISYTPPSPAVPVVVEMPSSTEAPATVQRSAVQSTPVSNEKARFCSKCGSRIDSKTKKCTGCGKQYFKGIPWKAVCNIAVALLLVASIAGNVVFYQKAATLDKEKTALEKEKTALENDVAELSEKNTALHVNLNAEKAKNTQLKKDNSALKSDLRAAENEIAFYDEYIVFIGDDGTRLYHNYRCGHRGGDSFWAYNISAAKSNGYKPCPYCWG